MNSGNGGGRKSPFAIRLSRAFDLLYHFVDPIQWQLGYVRTAGSDRRLHATVLSRERWIDAPVHTADNLACVMAYRHKIRQKRQV